MPYTEYLNLFTGEVTENHNKAVEWNRAGDRVEVRKMKDGNVLNSMIWD